MIRLNVLIDNERIPEKENEITVSEDEDQNQEGSSDPELNNMIEEGKL